MKSVQPNKSPRDRRYALLEEKRASSCTVDSIVVPRELWERTVGVIKTIRNARKGSCGSIDNVYCPGPINRHGIDNLWNEIQRHNKAITTKSN